MSNVAVAILGSFNIALCAKNLHQKISSFPISGKGTAYVIVMASFLASGAQTNYMPAQEGRYQNPWAQAAMLLPLNTLAFTAFWLVFVRDTGVAQGLEEGRLHRPIVGFLQRRFIGFFALAIALIILGRI